MAMPYLVLRIQALSFCTSHAVLKDSIIHSKKFKPSSQRWLQRQINDPFVKQGKLENYRCRSAFKLLEINKTYSIFKPGQIVVDLGCAPGSWTQVAVKAVQANIPASNSLVIGIDLSPVHPIEGATLLSNMDFISQKDQQQLFKVLGERKVNVVMSDMAPAASGIKSMDHIRIIKLCYSALLFAKKTSSLGSTLIMKAFDGSERQKLIDDAKKLYEVVRIVCPEASRKESSEIFVVCLNFIGEQSTTDDLKNILNVDNSCLGNKS